jgi:hypothetical protein
MGIPDKTVRLLRKEDFYMIHHAIEDYQKPKEIYRSSSKFGRNLQ